MPLPNNDFGNGKEVYFTESFKTMVRSEKEFILREASSVPILTPGAQYAYRFDIYRLLRSMQIPSYLWWVTAYINGIEDPFMDVSKLKQILKVNESSLEDRIVRSNTTQA